ncbi:MAG TPA: alpha/beta hydrolase [Bryobacteraceae bacterium]|jgi:acetyl esterase/lipase|nr:alpha/beta hydrolase [Bryobacteraceae bacterium]
MRMVALLLTFALPGLIQGAESAPSVPDSVSVERNIRYSDFDQTVLDIYQPKAAASGKRPGVLVIHGGGWTGGRKDAVVSKYVLPWVEKGFVAANVEYRLASVATAPAAITDVLNAAEWFRNNARKYNVDPKRIVVTGDSAGGHLSLMVGMTPKSAKFGPTGNVAAVVDFYGITDVADQLQGINMREYAVKWVPEQESRFELASKVSPISYVRNDVPPILCIHGNADEVVPYEHSVQLVKALRQARADAELIPIPNGAHGFDDAQMNRLFPQIFAFLQRRGILK